MAFSFSIDALVSLDTVIAVLGSSMFPFASGAGSALVSKWIPTSPLSATILSTVLLGSSIVNGFFARVISHARAATCITALILLILFTVSCGIPVWLAAIGSLRNVSCITVIRSIRWLGSRPATCAAICSGDMPVRFSICSEVTLLLSTFCSTLGACAPTFPVFLLILIMVLRVK